VPGPGSRIPFEKLIENIRNSESIVFPIYLDTEEENVKRYHVPRAAYAQAREQLGQIAQACGTSLYHAAKLNDLDTVYSQVVRDLSTVYSIGYRPSNKALDGKWRSVEVQLANRHDLFARTKRGYYAKTPRKRPLIWRLAFCAFYASSGRKACKCFPADYNASRDNRRPLKNSLNSEDHSVRKSVYLQPSLLSITLLLCCSLMTFGQSRDKFVISAKAGGINAITGGASVTSRGEASWQQLMITDDLNSGDRVRRLTGRPRRDPAQSGFIPASGRQLRSRTARQFLAISK
jgi:hypothetical protein